MKKITGNKNLFAIAFFAVAMAAMESAVVVYLRALYYPDGFTVALKLIDEKILFVEILRELATLIMIGLVAFLAGTKRLERFAYFLMCFAIWDIFYYVWLKVFINWPSSFLEWDILFLIPITWLGPVLSPIICSVTMILLTFVLLISTKTSVSVLFKCLLAGGTLLILYTYTVDYGSLLLKNDLISDYFHLFQNEKFLRLASAYLPDEYNWPVFWLGELLIGAAIFEHYFRKEKI